MMINYSWIGKRCKTYIVNKLNNKKGINIYNLTILCFLINRLKTNIFKLID